MPSLVNKTVTSRIPSRFFRERKLSSQTFGSFPYLSTRIFPALYNINLYPSELRESDLIEIARRQVEANKLPACLVFSWHRGLWFDGRGSEDMNTLIPKGGMILNGRIKAPEDVAANKGLVERSQLLDVFSSRSLGSGGYLVGEPSNCLRDLAQDDMSIGELRSNIIPTSISCCEICGDLKGECLYPESEFYKNKVWKLSCRCENDNKCVACGEALFHHKLDTCYFDKGKAIVLHVAGYLALEHMCESSNQGVRENG